MKQKLNRIIPVLILAITLFSCKGGITNSNLSKFDNDGNFIGHWVSTLPNDSTSVPIVISKKGDTFILKNTFMGNVKEFQGYFNNDKLKFNLGGFVGEADYIPDSDLLRMNTVNGVINYRRISPQEENKRTALRSKLYK